jgi:hypothetical protein
MAIPKKPINNSKPQSKSTYDELLSVRWFDTYNSAKPAIKREKFAPLSITRYDVTKLLNNIRIKRKHN